MKSFNDVISAVIVRVFEDWAMMLVEPTDWSSRVPLESECRIVEVNFQGVLDGRYFLVAPSEFLPLLATNVLGFDSEPDMAEAEDAFREMGNVLSGNLLTEMFGEDTVFEISLPRVRSVTTEDWELLHRNSVRSFYLTADDLPIAVTFLAGEEAKL